MAWTFKDWYEKNKKAVSERRRHRYKTDPEYRAAVLLRSSQRRKSNKVSKPPLPGNSAQDVCEILGTTSWTLNRWKNEGYFPVKDMRGYRFTDEQVKLLNLLKQFFEMYPKRASALHKDKLNGVVQTIHHNWE